jgi:hypothetical protein
VELTTAFWEAFPVGSRSGFASLVEEAGMAVTLMAAFLLRLSLWTLYTQSSSASRFTARDG